MLYTLYDTQNPLHNKLHGEKPSWRM